MVDRDDDVKIGIKSTAIRLQNDRLIIGILQVARTGADGRGGLRMG